MRRVFCDDAGDLGGIGALDRHQHHGGIVKHRRIFRQRQLVRRNPAVEALETGQPQPVAFDLEQSRAAAPARRPGGRPPPACHRQSSRCCRPRRCRSFSSTVIAPSPRSALGSNSRFLRVMPVAVRARIRLRPAPCNRHGPAFMFGPGGWYAAGITMGLLDILNGMQNGPRGPERTERGRQWRNVADHHGDPRSACLQGCEARRRRQPASDCAGGGAGALTNTIYGGRPAAASAEVSATC